jgi:RHS repeat-associated protein
LPFSEAVTGLTYVRNRWYEPSTGTFLSPDPLAYKDSSNLYAFAGGDPVNGRDPSGMGEEQSARAAEALMQDPYSRCTVENAIGSVIGTGETAWGYVKGAVSLAWQGTVGVSDPAAANAALDDAQDFLFHPIKRWNKVSREVANKQARGDCLGAGRTLQTQYVAPVTAAVVGGVEMVRGGVRLRTGAPTVEPPAGTPPPAEQLVSWVDEGGNLRAGKSAGMRPDAYEHQSSAPGARSNAVTGRSQAPYLEFTDPAGNVIGAKFDGAQGLELIDRKLNPVFSAKAIDQAIRQAAVARHYHLQAVWELPTQAALEAAQRFIRANNISGITLRIGPQ